MNNSLDVRFAMNGCGCNGLGFTQGEFITYTLTFFNPSATAPIDLTDAVVDLNLPLQGGGSIKRTSGPVVVNSSQIEIPNPPATPIGIVSFTDHGFVTGDPIMVAPVGAGVLPSPLVISTPYTISVIDVNSFEFADANGVVISLTDQGTGQFNINNTTDLVITTPAFGVCTFVLRSPVSLAANALLAQSFQVGYANALTNRILILRNILDVYFQPVS